MQEKLENILFVLKKEKKYVWRIQMLTKLAMHYSWSVRDNPNSICQAWIIFCRRSPSTDCFRFILMLAVCTLQLGETLSEVLMHCKYIHCKNYSFSLCPVSRCTFAVFFTLYHCSNYSGKM